MKGEEVNVAERKVSREHQTGQTSTSSTTATTARSHAHTHTPTHILYILATQLEPLSLEDASNPNILAIEEDISSKI